MIKWVRVETKWNELAVNGGEMGGLPEGRHVCVCVSIILHSAGGQRSPALTTTKKAHGIYGLSSTQLTISKPCQ